MNKALVLKDIMKSLQAYVELCLNLAYFYGWNSQTQENLFATQKILRSTDALESERDDVSLLHDNLDFLKVCTSRLLTR